MGIRLPKAKLLWNAPAALAQCPTNFSLSLNLSRRNSIDKLKFVGQ
jgi:hypothetical protein